MPIITHLVNHVFAYPLFFKVWIRCNERISINKFIAYSRN